MGEWYSTHQVWPLFITDTLEFSSDGSMYLIQEHSLRDHPPTTFPKNLLPIQITPVGTHHLRIHIPPKKSKEASTQPAHALGIHTQYRHITGNIRPSLALPS